MRPAHKNDARQLYQLTQQAFGGHSPWPLQLFMDLVDKPNKQVFVVERDDSIVGFVVATLVVGELEIDLLAVHPVYQRQGLAEALVQAVTTLPGVERSLLEVAADNLPAQRLYHKLGFTTYHRRINYYQERGIDALLMEKRHE